MNPLTKVKLINALNAQEAELGVREAVSWHAEYKDSAWIFVGRLHCQLTEGDVICVFSQYGEVVNINLVQDKRTGKSKGFCFLCYEDQRSTILAVDNFNGIKIKGRTIRVDHVANYQPPKESEDWDEVTRALHAKGCGLKMPPHTLSDSLSEDEDVPVKMQKKKQRSRAEQSKLRPQAGKQVSTEEPHPRIKIKKEKEDPGYERCAGRSSDNALVDFGSWERHTKGIGQKLLQKMGYVPGRGLGKNAQGIINPIDVKQRKGRGAVGAYGSERNLQSLQDFLVVDSEKEMEREFQKEFSQWQKGLNGGKEKPKYSYRTVEELKAKARISKQFAAPQKGLSQVKVIDMMGREPKVYYSYSQISHKHNIPDDSPQHPLDRDSKPQGFALPKLEHSLQLLIDITEQEIIQNDQQLQYERDMVVSLSQEIQKMAEVLSHEEKAISNLSKVLDMVEECERRMQLGCENPLTLDECAKIFETLQDKYYEESWMSYRVDLAVAIVYPLMKEYFKNWDPLKDCTYGMEIIAKWKSLLENSQLLSHSGQDLSTDTFHRLMWEIWMPHIRNIVARWQPRNCGSMVDFLDSWVNVVPSWILDNILDQLIFPKLQKEVESWNPLVDTVPIHSWIHPWLPLMQARLEPLYSPIRNKLAKALEKWHPSNSFAKIILQPWKDVFTPSSWEAFMVKNIVPKLGMCLNELIINPHQQHMDAFYWVIDWEEMISFSSLIGLLEKHFFPKWLQVLCSWLSNSPNYDEIIKWYLGWRSVFSDQVLAHPSIKDKFSEALHIMNHAVSSSTGAYVQLGAQENIAYLTHTEQHKDFQYEAMQERHEAENMTQHGIGTASGSMPMSFKDLIQTKAEEHNLVFMPIIGKWHEGKQLYTLGRIVICIDRGVVFVQEEKTWVPTSLQSLIDMAK